MNKDTFFLEVLIHILTKWILETPVREREKWVRESKVRIKNVFLFMVERFCLFLQMKRIFLFYKLFFFFYSFTFKICKNMLLNTGENFKTFS